MRWEIGYLVGSVLLGNERVECGKQIVAKLSEQLNYGNCCDAVATIEIVVPKCAYGRGTGFEPTTFGLWADLYEDSLAPINIL